jgi:phenylpropionate dioxygenase-like ring-hydroxylating dioxygenase large terminal subunit
MDMCKWSLESVADLDSHRGFVFATLSDDAQSLDEYLGDFKWYMDLALSPFENGMEVIHGPQRHVFNSNWKIGAENFIPDVYHSAVTHKTAIETRGIDLEKVSPLKRTGHKVIAGGHTTMVQRMEGQPGVYFGYPDSLELGSHLSEEQRELANRSTSYVGTIFPNTSFIDQFSTPADVGGNRMNRALGIRKWRPLGPDKTQFVSWLLVPKDAPDDFKESAAQLGYQAHGAAGSFEQDDTAVWEGIADAGGSIFAKKKDLKLNYEMDEANVVENQELDNDWVGPGKAFSKLQIDEPNSKFLRNWGRVMQNKEFTGGT